MLEVSESEPWGETPNPPDWLLSSLQADGCVPRHPLQIRLMVGRRGRFALDGSQVGSSVGDRLKSVKSALLDRNPLRCGNAKRPLSFSVNSIGGGFGGRRVVPRLGGLGEAPPRFGFTAARKGQKHIYTKELTTLKGLDFFSLLSS